MNSKKGIAALVIAAVLVIAGIVGAAAWYQGEKAKPRLLVETFLTSLQQTDLEAMKSMVQSSDFSVLEDTEIDNPVFQDFFHQMNALMTFDISKVRFNFQEGAAQVTAHIRYVDGSAIYRQTISDFTASLSEEELNSQETLQRLSEILLGNSEEFSTVYAEADVLYPLVKTEDEWKISSLDEQTVRIMSANFLSLQGELQRAKGGSAAPEEEASQQTSSLDLTTDAFSLKYTGFEIQNDYAGNPCLLLFYDYTNNGDTSSSALVDVHIEVYQHGKSMGSAIPASKVSEIDRYIKEVSPGETLNICQAFELTDLSDVTVQADEAFTLGGSNVHSQILTLK